MIDTHKAIYSLTKSERLTIAWLEQHGYEGSLSRQLLSRTEFTVHKNGKTKTLRIPQGRAFNVDRFLESIDKQFTAA